MANMAQPSAAVSQPPPPYLPIVLVMIALVFPVFAGNTDIFDQKAHRDFARILLEEGRLVTPHFGYHLLLLGVNATIPGGRLGMAAVAVNIAAYTLAGALFFGYAHRQLAAVFRAGRVALAGAVALAALCVIAGPPVMLSWYADFRLNGYIIYNQFHSPTQSVMLPMAIVVFGLCARLLTTGRLAWGSQALLLALAFAMPLTKPNFSMVLVPALAVVIVWRFARGQRLAWGVIARLVALVFVPTLIVLGWQFYFTYIQQTVIGYGINPNNGIIFAPLRTALYFDPDPLVIALKLTVSLAFPLWAALVYAEARRDLLVRLGWLMIAVGLAQYVLLSESGEFYMAANFNWGLRAAALCVFALSLVHAVCAEVAIRSEGAVPAARRLPEARLLMTVALVTLHVIGGAHLYSGYARSIIPTLP